MMTVTIQFFNCAEPVIYRDIVRIEKLEYGIVILNGRVILKGVTRGILSLKVE